VRLILLEPQLRHAAGENNLGPIRALVENSGLALSADDVLLLPERFHFGASQESYVTDVASLARGLGCHVVGGSHQEHRDGHAVNSGLVVAPDATVVGRYEKLRPYANERGWVQPGGVLGELVIGGRNVLVLICADFWFSDLIQRAERLPDLLLVPALSVTRKPTPDYSRALWRHLCIARAYEFGAYVGVSDWGYPSELVPAGDDTAQLQSLRAAGVLPRFSSGVAGFADPTTIDPDRLFQPVAPNGIRAYPIEIPALEAFRRDRVDRGFFWKAATGPARE
jgi:predicted amidohydrolase